MPLEPIQPRYVPRVLIAKPGLDGHERGAKVIASALRDAGMEVIYTGLRCSLPTIAASAVQEGVDVIGLSILSGAHLTICEGLRDQLQSQGAQDLPVVVGGVIPAADRPLLASLGVRRVFGPETPLDEVVRFISWLVEPKALITPDAAAGGLSGAPPRAFAHPLAGPPASDAASSTAAEGGEP